MPFFLEAANLSRMRSPVTFRSNWAKERRTLSVSRPIEFVVLKDCVTETKVSRAQGAGRLGGADFIARNMVTGKQIQVQLKSRIHFARKYMGKDIWIAFRHSDRAYLYPHDLLLEEYLKINPTLSNQAWNGPDGAVHSREPTKAQLALLKDYEVGWDLAYCR
jgi:hypothetical protein